MAIQIPYTDGFVPEPSVLNAESKDNKGVANGYAPLDANAKIPTANLPDQASLDAEVDGKITTHNSATTSVHGIADTNDLATKSYVETSVSEHKDEITSVHGIVNTGELIQSTAIGPNTDKIVTFNQSGNAENKSDSEIGAWGFGVENTSGDYINVEATHVGLNNGAKLKKGTTDGGLGGNKGIALKCSVDYELKWEAGRLYTMQQDGYSIRSVEHCMSVPSSVDDETKGYVVGTRWVMDSGKTYVCTDATEDSATWRLNFSQENDFNENVFSGSINTSVGVYNGEALNGGSIDTSVGGGSINTSNRGGSINTSGTSGGYNGGSINTSSGVNGAGGSINTSNRGGSIDISGGVGGSGGSITLRGAQDDDDGNIANSGSIDLSAGRADSCPGGSIFSTGGVGVSGAHGGTLNMSAGDHPGGSINTSNGGGSINTSGVNGNFGGSINTSNAGGSINTSNGGGSIDTHGTGSIQLGVYGTRTTLNGSASGGNKTITLPNATGTIALTSDSRFTDARVPTSHTHGNITNDGKVLVPYGGILSATGVDAGSFSNGTFPMIQGSGTGGVITILNGVISITSAGTGYVDGVATKAGGSRYNLVTQSTQNASANLPVITTTGGNISAGSFGTTSNTFCQGSDPRLSDQRAPKLAIFTNRDNIGSSTFLPITITGISKSSGAQNNVTITTQNPHNYNVNDIVSISGLQTSTAGTNGLANLSTLNGTYVVIAVTATTFTYYPMNTAALSNMYGAVAKLANRIITRGSAGDMELGNDYSTSADCLFVCVSTATSASVTSGTPLPVGVTSFPTWKKVALINMFG